MSDWIFSSFDILWPTLISACLVYVIIIIYTRIFGLRSFSKMSSFDFAMTIAIGSLLASTAVNKSTTIFQGGIALLALFFLQTAIAFLRRKFTWFSQAVDNKPILLMRDSKILHKNLKKVHLSEDDLRSKLREANVLNYSQVKAVIFETTGDVSVLHSDKDNVHLDLDLLKNVQDTDRFQT